jgi:hypothetical protein
MVREPTDLPDFRPRGEPDFDFSYTDGFEAALEALLPDELERRYFKLDGLEFRLNRRHDLQMLQGDPEFEGTGYIITEDGLANAPGCIAWFTIREAPGLRSCRFDSIEPTDGHYDEEDDT